MGRMVPWWRRPVYREFASAEGAAFDCGQPLFDELFSKRWLAGRFGKALAEVPHILPRQDWKDR